MFFFSQFSVKHLDRTSIFVNGKKKRSYCKCTQYSKRVFDYCEQNIIYIYMNLKIKCYMTVY